MSTSAKNPSAASDKTGEMESPFSHHFNEAFAESLGEAGSAYLRGIITLNREITNFINKRLEHDAELSRALGECKDMQQMTQIQQNWLREATMEYAENARSLMELGSKIVKDAWAPLSQVNDLGIRVTKD